MLNFDYHFGMDMELARSIERVQLEFMRTRVLEILDTEYPSSLHSDVVFLRLERDYKMEVGLRAHLKELHYLEEKELIRAELVFKDRFMCSVTAAGRDVLSGHTKVIGLADPSGERQ